MIRSANEISAMVAKAARGAGLPSGIAEDLAAAIPRHVQGSPHAALEALARHLADTTHVIAYVGELDAAAVKGGPCAKVEDACLLALTALAEGAPGRAGPFEIDDRVWQACEGWAARTHVPATAASRIAGAGAGLTDND